MSAAMTLVSDLITRAEAAILAGNLDEAETLTKQAEASQRLAAVKTAEAEAVKAQRLPIPTETTPPVEAAAQDVAVKTWFANRYGAFDAGLGQVARELYGMDYEKAAYLKNADFIRYIRTGQHDPRFHRMQLFSPVQMSDAILGGASVAELKATQIESQDVLGGFLVPEDLRDRIVQRLMGRVVMRKMGSAIPTSRDRVTMPVATGGDDRYVGSVRAFWVDESPTGSQSETNATFGQVSIPVHTLMANTPISKNILEDSQGALAIVGIVERQMADAFAITEDFAFLVGTGVGQPMGILLNATTGGPNTFAYGSVTTLNSGAATALTADAFRNMPYQLPAQYRDAGCAWILSRGTLRVIKTLKAGDGTYLWSGRSDTPQLAQGQPQSLEGYPFNETEVLAAPTTTSGSTYTANVYPVVFMARDAYQIVDRVGMDVTRYDDSTTAVANAIRLVARRRVGGQPVEPWHIAVMKVAA